MSNWKWLMPYFSKIKGSFISSISLEAVSVIAILVSIVLQKYIIDDIFGERRYDLIFPVMGGLAGAMLIYFLAHAAAYILMRKNSLELRWLFKSDILNYFYRVPMKEYQQRRIGEMAQYFSRDCLRAAQISNRILHGIVDTVRALFLIVTIGFTMPIVLVVFLAVTPVYITLAKRYAPRTKVIEGELLKEQSKISVLYEEGISGTREVVAFHRENWEMGRLKRMFHKYFDLTMRQVKLNNSSMYLSEIVVWGTRLFMLGFGGYQVLAGTISLGTFIVIYQLSAQLIDAVNKSYSFMVSLPQQFAVVERIRRLLEGKLQQDGSEQLSDPIRKLEVRKLSFQYQNDHNWILRNLDSDLLVGRKIAFVGASGGGKSTLAHLLARIYDPVQGNVFVNDRPLDQMRRKDWISRIAIVFQEPFFFPETIRYNLLMGRENISDEDMQKACEVADIWDVISNLPEELDTIVGERGVQFSGGQRQRLAIARAILDDPEILIFDEATSALDLETERNLQMRLDEQRKGKTTIVVAHRLTTILNADVIYVFEQGRVVEHGSHDQLLAGDSLYRRLVAAGE